MDITLAMDISAVRNAKPGSFEAALAADIAALLGIGARRVLVHGVLPASVRVTVSVPAHLLARLQAALATPGASLAGILIATTAVPPARQLNTPAQDRLYTLFCAMLTGGLPVYFCVGVYYTRLSRVTRDKARTEVYGFRFDCRRPSLSPSPA